MDAYGTAMAGPNKWLKYIYKGKTVYMPLKNIRYAMSWEELNTLGLTKATRQITIGGKQYTVRLPTGYDTAVTSHYDVSFAGSFNDLIYPIYAGLSLPTPQVQAYPRWAAYNDDAFGFGKTYLEVAGGLGTMSWVQEEYNGNAHMARAYNDVYKDYQLLAGWFVNFNGRQNYVGWRPIVELVE